MASEGRRSLVRVMSNYGRLLATFCMGLLLVRVLLQALGNEAWGLIALMGSTIGLTAMLNEIVNTSMIRELGAAHHSNREGWFGTVYNAALLLSLAVAVLTTVVLAIIWAIVPWLDVPDALIAAARWMVVFKAIEAFARITLAAPFNMLLVTERMVPYNVLLTLDRSWFLVGALFVAYVVQPADVAGGVIVFAAASSGAFTLAKVAQATYLMAVDRRLIPSPRSATREGFRSVAAVGGWNAATVTALTLHLRFSAILMNLFFGLVMGNLVFGLAVQLSGYVRMLARGMTDGLDAVSARLSSGESGRAMQGLLTMSTRLHGLVVFPAGLVMIVLAEPVLEVWVGSRLDDPAATVPPTVTLVRILTLGIVCRSIGDGWTGILYGAGHIRRYAPMMLAIGVANPIVAIVLMLVLPDHGGITGRFTGPAWSYSLTYLLLFLVFIPWQVSRVLGIGVTKVVRPLLRPFLVTAVSAPLLVMLARTDGAWTLLRLGGVLAAYGAVSALLLLLLGMTPTERQWFFATLRRQPPAP